MDEPSTSPIWPVAILGVFWITFLVTFPGMDNIGSSNPETAIASFSVLLSIPILWVDARNAIRSGEFSTTRPIYIVIAVYLLYLVTMPAYVVYRVYRSRRPSSSHTAG